MQHRIATGVMLRRWVLAAGGLGLVVLIAIATAPKPTCRAANRAPSALVERTRTITWSPPPRASSPCDRQTVWHVESIETIIERQLACARSPYASVRTVYLGLMLARSLDLDGTYTARINAQLVLILPRAAIMFMAQKDYDNAASAVMLANSLGLESIALRSVQSSLDDVR